jgi:hypothetical protein
LTDLVLIELQCFRGSFADENQKMVVDALIASRSCAIESSM